MDPMGKDGEVFFFHHLTVLHPLTARLPAKEKVPASLEALERSTRSTQAAEIFGTQEGLIHGEIIVRIQWQGSLVDGVASGYVKIAIEHGHRNSGFTRGYICLMDT